MLCELCSPAIDAWPLALALTIVSPLGKTSVAVALDFR